MPIDGAPLRRLPRLCDRPRPAPQAWRRGQAIQYAMANQGSGEGKGQMGIARAIAVASMLVVSPGALAQGVTQAERIEVQPLVYSDDEGIHGCGFRMLAFAPSPHAFMEVADFSVNFFSNGGGMMKASLITIPSAQ